MNLDPFQYQRDAQQQAANSLNQILGRSAFGSVLGVAALGSYQQTCAQIAVPPARVTAEPSRESLLLLLP